MTDLDAAAQFVAAHARLIDRRRFAFIAGHGSAEAVLRALAAYRNADGGIGHIEPDLRTPASQPSCVLYALEILDEISATDLSLAIGALDWVQTETKDDGGVPFVLPSAKGWPHAPWFQPEDSPKSSVLMTAGIAAMARRLKLEHDWLGPATAYCWEHVRQALDGDPYTVRYVLDFLDSASDSTAADDAITAFAERIPADGVLRVQAGTQNEALRPLDLAPWPTHAARRLFDDRVIERELDKLAADQRPDGGWAFSWGTWNPAVAWEWRGAVTVAALRTLRNYHALERRSWDEAR